MLRRSMGLLPNIMAAFLAAGSAAADFDAAVRAFDAGVYEDAAAKWRSRALACDPLAQTALAGLYRTGLGVPRNEVEALRWYLLAARADEPFAQQAAGDAFAQGEVVPVDRVRAAFWLTLAARHGLAWSAQRRDALVKVMDGIEQGRLARRLSGFHPADPANCRSSG